MGEREFVLYVALLSAMVALAIDMLLPAFEQMRAAFDLSEDSTSLALTMTLFFMGVAVGTLFYGPISDNVGRKRVLLASTVMYAGAALVAALSPSLTVVYASRFAWGLAAAGPRTLSQAIVRDRFAGTAMARVMTLVQAVFFIGPIVAPVLGKGLVEIGSWRWVMAFGVFTALVALLWSLRLAETLAPEARRPLRLGAVFVGFRTVLRNRIATGYMLANTFVFAAFYSFLASTELVFSSVYQQPEWFVPYFTAMSVLAATVAVGANRLLRRVEADRLALGAGTAFVIAAAALLAVTVAGDGRPEFVLWLIIFSAANSSHTAFFPTCISLSLEPMGRLAGTASSVIVFSTSMFGSLLASFTDRAIDDTVTPISVAYLGYGLLALACQLWARGGRSH
jgi:DHA1 family bicyclomycin/chloramphenicol resistance-like MFS transporter